MIWNNNKKNIKDKFKKDFFLRLGKVEQKKNKSKTPETSLEVETRFAKLRQARAKEKYGPGTSDNNNFTYGDVWDEITDEEIEYYCLGTTHPELKAVRLSDPRYELKVQECQEWKRERDSRTRLEKRESRQRVHNYCLRYDDYTPEEREYWNRKYKELLDAHPGIKKSLVEGWTYLESHNGRLYVNGEPIG
jgi:hypothetical protein